MVARKVSVDSLVSGSLSTAGRVSRAWFLTWRLMLTKAFHMPAEALRRTRYRPRPSLLLNFLGAPEKTVATDAEVPCRLSALGMRMFAAGALIWAIVSIAGGADTAVSFTRALGAAAWADARLAIMLFYAPRGREVRGAVTTGWAIGLIPYVIGATAGLRVVAFFASAIYTEASLSGVGLQGDESRSLTIRAFGIQAIVVTTLWGFRSITALLVVLGASL